jgi:hypothetical protein
MVRREIAMCYRATETIAEEDMARPVDRKPWRRSLPMVALLAALAACGRDDVVPGAAAVIPGFTGPDIACPGQPQCTGQGGEARLSVGVGAQAYTPTLVETFTDEDQDGERDADEPFVDADQDGKFEPLWLFGGTPANGIKTDIEARAIAFAQHDLLVVICELDTIGMLAEDFDLIRADPALAGLGIDHIVLGATHAHLTPDTVGISNANPLQSGIDPVYVAALRAAAVQAIKEAVMTLEPARLRVARTLLLNDPADPTSGTDRFNKDIRDPVIYDPTLTIARFVRAAAPDETIATLVNWGNHPELAFFADPPEKNQITAHYVHWLREGIEAGVGDVPGLGGTTVFVNGALGGQVGSLRGCAPVDPLTDLPVTVESHAMDEALGRSVAVRALEALAGSGVEVTELPLSFRSTEYPARIDNVGFQTLFLLQVLAPHRLYGYDPSQPIDETNTPWLPLRATYVQVGPLGMVTAPGELHPELWVGVAMDGSWSWGYDLLSDPTAPNQPNWALAAPPPYLRDLVLANPGVTYPMLLGQAEDYIGYIVPAYNYALDPDNPYLSEAEGDHYEEVYSLGPDGEAHIVEPILELVSWRP